MPGFEDVIERWLQDRGLTTGAADVLSQGGVIALVVICAFLANFVGKRIVNSAVKRVARHTETTWDDIVVRHRVFDRFSQLAPALVIYMASWVLFPEWPHVQAGLRHLCIAYMVLVVGSVVSSVIGAVGDIYREFEVSRSRPIASYLQVLKVVTYAVTAVLTISIITDRSPWAFLSGLAGLSAVLLLVFKDSLLGLVAGVQLTANNMLRVGDWIEMPQYGADGKVTDISLNTVKIQNWDKTISTVPTYTLVTSSFKNWRGMEESGGRRIKRAVFIDLNTIAFLNRDAVARFKKVALLHDYLTAKEQEIETDRRLRNVDAAAPANGRRLTNLGTYRAYAKAYLAAHPMISSDMTFLVRQLPPSPHGIGIEIYVFSKDQVWANYENIQADIFDHLLSMLPEFGLRAFQEPSGRDVRVLAETVDRFRARPELQELQSSPPLGRIS